MGARQLAFDEQIAHSSARTARAPASALAAGPQDGAPGALNRRIIPHRWAEQARWLMPKRSLRSASCSIRAGVGGGNIQASRAKTSPRGKSAHARAGLSANAAITNASLFLTSGRDGFERRRFGEQGRVARPVLGRALGQARRRVGHLSRLGHVRASERREPDHFFDHRPFPSVASDPQRCALQGEPARSVRRTARPDQKTGEPLTFHLPTPCSLTGGMRAMAQVVQFNHQRKMKVWR